MASISAAARDALVAIHIGMFNAAPGAARLSSMVLDYENGQTLKQIAAGFSTDADFRSQYPGFLTAEEFADRMVANLLGDNADATTKTWSKNYVIGRLNAGVPDTEVFVLAVNALRAATNPDFAVAQTQLENKLEVAKYYAIDLEQNSTDYSVLRSLIANVDETQASVDTAVTSIGSQVQSFSLTAGASSVNEGGTVSFTLSTDAVPAGTNIAYTISGVNADDVDGALTGTAVVDSNGKATISVKLLNDLSTEGAETVTVALDNGRASASATVTDTSLTPVYTVAAGAATANEGDTVTFTVTADQAVTGSAAVTITGIDAADVESLPTSVSIVDGKGTITLVLKGDVTTEGSETISVKVGDSTATTTVADTSVTPILGTDSTNGTIVSGQGTAIITPATILSNDFGADGKAIAADTAITIVAGSATNGEVFTTKDGNFLFVASAGERIGSFKYTVAGQAGEGTVNVTLNTTPVVTANDLTVKEDVSVDGTVTVTDGDNDTITYTYAAKNGTVTDNGDGKFSYKGNANFNGSDTITVQVNDGYTTVEEEIAVTVTADDDAPTKVDPAPAAVSANSGSTVTVDLSKYATDVDSASLTYTAGATTTNGGTISITGNTATITYPQGGGAGAVGADSFKISATDGTTTLTDIVVALTVVNTAPSATNFSLSAKTGVTQTVDLTGQASDPEGNTLTPTVVVGSLSNGGSAEVIDGKIVYTSTIGYVGTETLRYTVSDGFGGASSEGTITFTVASNTGGTSGNDLLYGSTSAEAIDGLLGNDTINGGGGADTITGGDGNDTVTYNDNAKQLFGGNGSDTLVINSDAIAAKFDLSSATDQVTDASNTTIIVRTFENIDATKSSNAITIDAANADTTSLTLSGQGDTITTMAAVTGTGVVVSTLGGNDTITTGASTGTFSIDGGAGNDTIDASASTKNNTIIGGDGNDTITTESGISNVTGGAGNDTIKTVEANMASTDSVTGGDGTDILEITDAATVTDAELTNYATVETLKLSYAGSASTAQTVNLAAEALGAGIVTVDVTAATGDVTVTAAAGYTGNLTVLTSANDNSITGSSGNDVIVTNATSQLDLTATGNDSIAGGTGTDQIRVDNDSGTDGTGNAVSVTVGSGLVSGVEQIVVNDTATDNAAGDVTVTFLGAYAVTTGLTIDGSAMDSGEVLTVDTSANTTSETVTITGGAGADVFTLSSIADSVNGGAGADTFKYAEANLASGDSVTGGEGTDILEYTDAAALADAELTNFDSVETVKLAAGAASQSLTFAAEALGAGITTIDATASTQDVTVTVQSGYTASLTVLTTSADNSITGGSGNDIIVTNATSQLDFTATGNDSVAGGTGTDQIRVDNDSGTDGTGNAVSITVGSGLVSGVEQIVVNDTATDNAAGDVTVTFLGAYAVTTGLTIDGSAMDSGEVLTVDTSANTTSETVTITGGAGADVFTLSSIADSVNGGTGNDTFKYAEANMASSDSVTGGEGTDILELTDAATITDAELTNYLTVETIKLAAAGGSVTLDAQALEAGVVTIDLTAGTADGTVTVTSGYTGNLTVLTTSTDNSITGGSGDDTIVTNATSQLDFTATGNDSVTGGTGTDKIRIDNDSGTDGTGNAVSLTVGSGLVSGVEQIVVNDTATDNAAGDITVTFVAGFAMTSGLTVDGSAMDAGEVLTVDTSANTTSESVTITGGAADDVFTLSSIADSVSGGAGNDTFNYAIANLASNDTIDGGSGTADAITFSTAASIADSQFTNITGVEKLNFASGSATYNLGAQALEAGITTVVASGDTDSTVTINAGGYGSTAVSISVSLNATDDDTALNIFGGAGNDTINLNNSYGTGADFVQGGAGADTVTFGDITSATSVDTVRINLSSDLASGTTVTSADTYNAWQDGTADLIEFVGATLASGGGGQVVMSTTLDDLNTAADVYKATTVGELATFNAGGVGSAYIIVLDDVAGLAGTGGNGFTGGASAATSQGAIDAAVTYLTGNSIASTAVANTNVILVVSVDTDNSGASNGVALFQYQEGALDAGIQSSELTLIGIFNGVDVDNLEIADFK